MTKEEKAEDYDRLQYEFTQMNQELKSEKRANKRLNKQLALYSVVNCVYVVTERDNYGEQLFRQVFAKEEQAIEYLAKQGLKAGNIDEINEIELY